MCRVEFFKIGKRDVTFIREMRVNLESNLLSPQFSEKTNETHYPDMSIFFIQNNEFRSIFGRINETVNCFRDLLTFRATLKYCASKNVAELSYLLVYGITNNLLII